eukprot:3504256-Alexandrium_andersonii.AAC.1
MSNVTSTLNVDERMFAERGVGRRSRPTRPHVNTGTKHVEVQPPRCPWGRLGALGFQAACGAPVLHEHGL